MKPSLAKDAIIEEVTFPCWVEPKIDGVRAMNIKGTLTGRSLDPFEGFGITEFFSKPEFVGLDGEMILGSLPNSPDRLCSKTTGAMGRIYEEDNKKKLITQMADVHWWVFDYLVGHWPTLPYQDRYGKLRDVVQQLAHPRIHLVSFAVCDNLQQLKTSIEAYAAMNYEGTIIRNPRAPYKEGRSSKKLQELWRVKPWADAEVLVTGITEGNKNTNEKTTNSLGRGERSSAKAGMVPNGMIGSIQGTLTEDFIDPISGKKLFDKGLPCTIAPGEMTDEEAKHLFENPDQIVAHIVKFQHMTHGTKDQPRFGGYMSHRLAQDIS